MSEMNENIIKKLHKDLLGGKIKISDLKDHKGEFAAYYKSVYWVVDNNTDGVYHIDIDTLRQFVMLCLDYYTYSPDGDVLINDSEYDFMMNVYCQMANTVPFIKPDYEPESTNNGSTWELAKHTAPWMVGTVSKFYDIDKMYKWILSYKGLVGYDARVVIAPKYDGVSTCIRFINGQISQALTRKNTIVGQDITACVNNAWNHDDLWISDLTKKDDAYVKCEILMSYDDFKGDVAERYTNRRSAVSGIIGTPKNVDLAHALTIMPLCYWQDNHIIYKPANSISTTFKEVLDKDLLEHYIGKMLYKMSSPSFPYRYDGVIIFIDSPDLDYAEDIMRHARAYKINTAYGQTTIKRGYVSIGRTGKATPMIEVYPCAVNETEVTDVSLSNFKKANEIGLHENDRIQIVSAGDVIPQLDKVISRDKSQPGLYFDMRCPHCGMRLTSINATEYGCTNKSCPRIISGEITNFLTKMGVKGISDTTIEDICTRLHICEVTDILKLTEKDLVHLDGWGNTSAKLFVNEIERIKHNPVPYSTFIGALGIPNVSKKKCRKFMTDMTVDYILDNIKTRPGYVYDKILGSDGMGLATTEVIMNYFKDNYDYIKELSGFFTLKPDKAVVNNIVFTMFRDKDAIAEIEEMGYEISENVNKDTIAVISPDMGAKKILKAKERGIATFHSSQMSELMKYLEAWKED